MHILWIIFYFLRKKKSEINYIQWIRKSREKIICGQSDAKNCFFSFLASKKIGNKSAKTKSEYEGESSVAKMN